MNQEEFDGLLAKAEAGDVDAMFGIGIYYAVDGQNEGRAFPWFKKAAELGHKDAMYFFGQFFREGRNVQQDDVQAFFWFKKAAELGHAQAMNNLAFYYQVGEGVVRDEVLAVTCFEKSANLGCAAAMLNLGSLYWAGKVEGKDYGDALPLYKQAADLGDVDAMFALALFYDTQIELKNDVVSLEWFRKAAKLGHRRAVNFLIQKTCGKERDEWLGVYFELQAPVFKRFNELCDGASQDCGSINKCKAVFKRLLTRVYNIEVQHWYQGNIESEGLTHYTSAKAALNIILKKPCPDKVQVNEDQPFTRKLRIGMAAYLNDPTEGKYVFDAVQKANDVDIQHIQNRFERFYADAEPIPTNELPEQIFSLSFSKNRDNLNLWRAYGTTNGQADGVGLFIPNQTLSRFALDGLKSIQTESFRLGEDADDFLLFEVKYGEVHVKEMWAKIQPALDALFKRIKALDASDEIRDQMDRCIVLALSRLTYLYKHDAYAAEQEVRAIALRPLAQAKMDARTDECTPSRLYCETPELLFLDKGSSIILGPQTADKTALLWETRKRLALLGLDDKVSVTVSTVPFR